MEKKSSIMRWIQERWMNECKKLWILENSIAINCCFSAFWRLIAEICQNNNFQVDEKSLTTKANYCGKMENNLILQPFTFHSLQMHNKVEKLLRYFMCINFCLVVKFRNVALCVCVSVRIFLCFAVDYPLP